MTLFESVRCIGEKVIFEFKTEHDAKIFKEIYENPKTNTKIGKNNHTKVERRGRWVAIYFPTKKDAKLRFDLIKLSHSGEKDYKSYYIHPLETQGKRCKNCD